MNKKRHTIFISERHFRCCEICHYKRLIVIIIKYHQHCLMLKTIRIFFQLSFQPSTYTQRKTKHKHNTKKLSKTDVNIYKDKVKNTNGKTRHKKSYGNSSMAVDTDCFSQPTESFPPV